MGRGGASLVVMADLAAIEFSLQKRYLRRDDERRFLQNTRHQGEVIGNGVPTGIIFSSLQASVTYFSLLLEQLEPEKACMIMVAFRKAFREIYQHSAVKVIESTW
jgi:hypothetical protein